MNTRDAVELLIASVCHSTRRLYAEANTTGRTLEIAVQRWFGDAKEHARDLSQASAEAFDARWPDIWSRVKANAMERLADLPVGRSYQGNGACIRYDGKTLGYIRLRTPDRA